MLKSSASVKLNARLRASAEFRDLEESEIVVNRLLDLHTFKNVPWREMAILYRTNAQSRPLEEALRKRGLPYKWTVMTHGCRTNWRDSWPS